MKIILTVAFLLLHICSSFAQFGDKKKEDIDKLKDSRLVVVLFADSAYNASVKFAVERYWSFNGGFLFVHDSAMKAYAKGEYSYLIFSKSKGTKIKAKLCASDPDFNGLLILNKYKKKATELEIIARAYCSNTIDTSDWKAEMIRGVQLLNNYLNIAVEAASDKEMSESYLMSRYPTDKSMMSGRKLLIEGRLLDITGKVDAPTLLDGDIEELADNDDINKSIVSQDAATMHYFFSNDENNCNKLVVTSDGQLMYFKQESRDKCKCESSDLKSMKSMKDKADRE